MIIKTVMNILLNLKKWFTPLKNVPWLAAGLSPFLRIRGFMPRVRFLMGFTQDNSEHFSVDPGAGYIKGIYSKNGRINKILIEQNKVNPAQIIGRWLKKEGLLTVPVTVSLKGPNTLIRYVPFPRVKESNLKTAVSYELNNLIPFKPNDVYFDVFVVDENYSAKDYLIVIAIVKKDYLDKLIEDFNSNGINLAKITLNNISLINLLLSTLTVKENLALVDIGSFSTLVNLIKAGIPCLSREINISPADSLRRIAGFKDLSLTEAERLRSEEHTSELQSH